MHSDGRRPRTRISRTTLTEEAPSPSSGPLVAETRPGRLRVEPAGAIMTAVKGTLERAFGYQGDAMNLPVADLDAAIPFYERVLGFRVASRSETPHKSAVLERDDVRMTLAENGGDASQDGCAFHVKNLDALYTEFEANGLRKDGQVFDSERHGDVDWRVFYVVAPDGLCYWFGEEQTPSA
jgi:lactoylglutathione lyase